MSSIRDILKAYIEYRLDGIPIIKSNMDPLYVLYKKDVIMDVQDEEALKNPLISLLSSKPVTIHGTNRDLLLSQLKSIQTFPMIDEDGMIQIWQWEQFQHTYLSRQQIQSLSISAILESFTFGIFIFDTEETILYKNPWVDNFLRLTQQKIAECVREILSGFDIATRTYQKRFLVQNDTLLYEVNARMISNDNNASVFLVTLLEETPSTLGKDQVSSVKPASLKNERFQTSSSAVNPFNVFDTDSIRVMIQQSDFNLDNYLLDLEKQFIQHTLELFDQDWNLCAKALKRSKSEIQQKLRSISSL